MSEQSETSKAIEILPMQLFIRGKRETAGDFRAIELPADEPEVEVKPVPKDEELADQAAAILEQELQALAAQTSAKESSSQGDQSPPQSPPSSGPISISGGKPKQPAEDKT